MIIINENICDNAKECSGIEVCPTGAIFWDEVNGKIAVDQDQCVSCGTCVAEGCPIGAITVVSSQEEYDRERAKIDAEDRTPADLFVERYGAQPIVEEYLIEYDQIDSRLKEGEITLVELFNDNSIQCLAHSIPVTEIQEAVAPHSNFYKCDVGEDLNITTIRPSLAVYFGKTKLGVIEGYYTDKDKEIFFGKIEELLATIK